MRDGEILKNFGEFGESDTNFLKRDEDNLLDYFHAHDQTQDDEVDDQDDDITRNRIYGSKNRESSQKSKQSRRQDPRYEDDTLNSNFNERNNRIIDRFDLFFDKMGIKEKKGAYQVTATH